MEKQLKKLARILQTEYGSFITLSLLLFISYETGICPEGAYADDPRMRYILGTAGILTTIILIPLSLKLFSQILKKRVKEAPLPEAIHIYKVYGSIRILLFAVVVIMNLLIYYATLENTGGLCALIGLTASLFCLPGLQKIRNDLDLHNIKEL